jgi:hypothetical protein
MFIHLLAGAAAAAAVPTAGRDSSPAVDVSKDVPGSVGAAVLHPFVSFSIEFSSFPDFAGLYLLIDDIHTKN